MSKLKDKNFIYLICGRGVLKEYLERKIQELRLENKAKLLGYRRDVIEILKTADLFIFPSKREGLPVSVIEAMAAGLPVIASNVRGNRDLIEKENLFEPNDVKTLTRLIEKRFDVMENDGFRKETYTNLEQYSLTNVLKQMAEIYEEQL